MALFSFDDDDHPNLRERTFSVDATDFPQEALANLRLQDNSADKDSHVYLNGSNGNRPGNNNHNKYVCPILAPRPLPHALTVAGSALSTHSKGSTAMFSTVGVYQTNGNSSNKHLPAFFHQVDREQAMTPDSTFRSQQTNDTAAAAPSLCTADRDSGHAGSSQSSDSEADNVEYEVKIDQDFDAHAPQTADSRGHSPRPGQLGVAGAGNNGSPGSQSLAPNGSKSPAVGPRRPKHKMTPDDFKFLKVIGRGAYGKVYLVRHIATNALYAMKVLKKASIIVHAKDTECTMSERKILEAIRHPFIVKLHYAFQTDHRLYLILEYASGGELFTHLATERMFSEETTAFYAAQLVLALEHLHSLGIIYRDLKPENIMLNAHGDIVLTDFGLSKVPLENSEGRTNTVCGTIEYMAPEVISERVHYDKTVDWWSLGIVIHDMLTGSPPFVANNRKKTMDAILNKKLNLPYYLSSDAKDLLTKLLKRVPSARLGHGPKGLENIKKHRFFRKIDWKLLITREMEAPIVPFLSDPESVENFNSEFTNMPVQESPILTHGTGIRLFGFEQGGGAGTAAETMGGRSVTPGLASGHHTPTRYMTAPSSASSGVASTLNGQSQEDYHAGGIPMVKTRSSSPDHHHFQDFSYISTSHLPTLGFLDSMDDHVGEH